MLLDFVKMHSLGNDFVVINGFKSKYNFSKDTLKYIAQRHLGVGCDQIIVIKPANNDELLFSYLVFNADGGEAEQCLNGGRCAAWLMYQLTGEKYPNFKANCLSGELSFSCFDNHASATIHHTPLPEIIQLPNYLQELELFAPISAIKLGNPHVVIPVVSLSNINLHQLSQRILNLYQDHSFFAQGVNLSFVEKLTCEHVKLRVVERGSGLTLSCGSAANASFMVAIIQNWLEKKIIVEFKHGYLHLQYENQSITQLGLVNKVFNGQIEI